MEGTKDRRDERMRGIFLPSIRLTPQYPFHPLHRFHPFYPFNRCIPFIL